MKSRVEVKALPLVKQGNIQGFNGIHKDDFRTNYGVYTNEDINEGEIVLILTGEYKHHPSRATIQIGEKHIDSAIGGYINHSCDPNTMILCRLRDMQLRERYVPIQVGIKGTLTSFIIGQPMPVVVASKKIFKGAEITFDYKTTETLLAEPFKCKCGAENCVGYIE
jgi:hypothetical protein